MIGPYVPLATLLGRLATGLAGENLERVEVSYTGQLADADTRLLTSAVLSGAFGGYVEEHVNLVNARAVAEQRGIKVTESATPGNGALHEPGHRPLGAGRGGIRHHLRR